MTVHLVRMRPDVVRLSAFAAARRLLPRSGDLGYALHVVLRTAYGAAAPQPFRYFENTGLLLAYGGVDAEGLATYAGLPTNDGREQAVQVLGGFGCESKPMPDRWQIGTVFAFEVRTRPVRRYGRSKEGEKPRERDAFLAAIQKIPEQEQLDRREVYKQWLSSQLARQGADVVAPPQIEALRRTDVLRSPHRDEPPQSVNGPDVQFSGHLRVSDAEKFGELVSRGLGRHRAFGFGMVLLSPPRRM